MDIRLGFRRVGVTIAACSVLFTGISATAAQAAGATTDKPKEDGSIEVCKRVTGPGYDDYKKKNFNFVIRDKDDRDKYPFDLKDKKWNGEKKGCHKQKNLEDGKYRIVEKNVPEDCAVKIAVTKGEVVSFKGAAVVVRLKGEKNEVEVTYTNRCQKKHK